MRLSSRFEINVCYEWRGVTKSGCRSSGQIFSMCSRSQTFQVEFLSSPRGRRSSDLKAKPLPTQTTFAGGDPSGVSLATPDFCCKPPAISLALERDVVGFIALDLVAWIVLARMKSVAFTLELFCMDPHDFTADAPGLRVPARGEHPPLSGTGESPRWQCIGGFFFGTCDGCRCFRPMASKSW